ncbi:TenA family protein [Saccharopolyspora sp. SCSIO 74807]|uniref:TenA family protein n=1 Tax=Saccharopolyspora sp. SCSIO 74807 TaxID=3118084 RepID=UPI0030D16BD3
MSFTDWLRARSEPDWTAVITHPFTDALFDGSLPDPAMRSYLVQDYQFVDDFLALLGAALAKADRYTSRLAIAGSIGVVTSEENTYFERSFDALGVSAADREQPVLDEATKEFRALMTDTNARGDYAEVLTVLAVAEWSYLAWAQRAPEAEPAGGTDPAGNFVQAEWVSLHNNDGFAEWVRWLRAELDRVGAELDERDQARCLRLFQRATRCERDFFDAHWPGGASTGTS